MMNAAGAEIAVAVSGNLGTYCGGAQVRYMAEKVDWRFAISVFQFAIGRAHGAERLNAALDAPGGTGTFGGAQIVQ